MAYSQPSSSRFTLHSASPPGSSATPYAEPVAFSAYWGMRRLQLRFNWDKTWRRPHRFIVPAVWGHRGVLLDDAFEVFEIGPLRVIIHDI